VKIWKLGTKDLYEEERVLAGHRGWVWDCDFSQDSKILISVSTDPVVRLWKLDTGEIGLSLQGHTKGIITLAFNDSDL
jgi:target of rapamycin complex subunit LST8